MRKDLRAKRVGVRLNESELAKARELAALQGCTLSAAVRNLILGTQVKTVTTIDPPQTNQLVTA